MNLHAFVFSNKPSYRLSRHALFWFIWILYYALTSALIMWKSYGFLKSFVASFVEVAESTPLDMCFCYFVIYYLFPNFLNKGKYVSMLLLWCVASVAELSLYELNAYLIVPHIRMAFGFPSNEKMFQYFWSPNNLWNLFSLFSQINMEGCIAASIKLGKLRYISQQEVDLLKQQKEKIEPAIENGMMAPALLTELLNRLEKIADSKPVAVAQSVTKIKRLFTYMLYENTQAKVLLRDELKMLQEYISLEQLTAYENVLVQTNIQADVNVETIAPLIIIPFAENAFTQVYLQPIAKKFISISIQMQHDILYININWSKPADTSTLAQGRNVILQNVAKRLQLIYPQSHELKTRIEVEKVVVTLSIDLKKAIN